jgi:hypothetical protein|tara:strand:- start:122 stop:301 length:180 start_codon:yes stop_codon:yes gene_type:complete
MKCFSQQKNQPLDKKDWKMILQVLKVNLRTLDNTLFPSTFKKNAINDVKMLIKKVEKQL